MKKLIRRWILHYKRKRYHRHLRESGNYKALENSIKETGTLCSNCNAPLTGPFCHICGQKDDDLKRPIWTLLREILDDVFSPDSRLFKTLILLVLVPGGLTRAFRDGRRARFVPPLRLYLVISILFFVIIKVADILILDIHVKPIDDPVSEQSQSPEPPEDPEGSLDEQEAAIPAPGVVGAEETAANDVDSVDADDRKGRAGLSEEDMQALRSEDLTPEEKVRLVLGDDGFENLPESTKKALREGKAGDNISIDGDDLIGSLIRSEFKAANGEDDDGGIDFNWPYSVEVDMFVKNSKDEREGLKQEDIDKFLNDPDQSAFMKRVVRGLGEALKDPESFNELFNDWLPPALFILMPFFAFILRIFHWGKDRVYLQQFVFSLHFHTFLFLLMTAMTVIVPTYGGDLSVAIFWWGTSLYLIIALKIGQGQGWLKAFFKAGPIWVTYFVVMVLVMAAIVFAGLGDIDVIDLMMGDTSAFDEEA